MLEIHEKKRNLKLYPRSLLRCVWWHVNWPNFMCVCVCVCTHLSVCLVQAKWAVSPCIADRKSMTHSVGPILLYLCEKRERQREKKREAGGQLTHCKHYGFMSLAYDKVVTHLLPLNFDFHCER